MGVLDDLLLITQAFLQYLHHDAGEQISEYPKAAVIFILSVSYEESVPQFLIVF